MRAVTDVMACEFGDGLAVLHHASGEFFVLDEVGSYIFKLLERPHTPGEIAIEVGRSYAAGGDVIGRDVSSFLQTMVDSRLIEIGATR